MDNPIITTNHQPEVWVWHPRFLSSRAICDCGWTGERRIVAGLARLDAWGHANRTSHLPAANFNTRKAAA